MTVYEIYDSRYIDHPEDSYCFEVCDTLQKAINNRDDYGDGNIIVKCILKKVSEGKYEEVLSKIIEL